MANAEHVALLKNSVAAWNAWLRENPDISPDLSNADLIQADLRLANLSRANMSGAKLTGPETNRMVMAPKILVGDLKNIPGHGADLSGANLSEANLT
jgi:uncharacterized protein YjbI with pentapeptide repeats